MYVRAYNWWSYVRLIAANAHVHIQASMLLECTHNASDLFREVSDEARVRVLPLTCVVWHKTVYMCVVTEIYSQRAWLHVCAYFSVFLFIIAIMNVVTVHF